MATGLKWAYFTPGADASSPPQPWGAGSPQSSAELNREQGVQKAKICPLADSPQALGWWLYALRGQESVEGR